MEISENLTPLEEAQRNAMGFAANASLHDLIKNLITRGSELEAERADLDWRNGGDDRQRMVQLLRESRDITNTLVVIATLNELHYGISA